MLIALKIAVVIAGVPLGIWLGIRVACIAISWLKYLLKGMKPPKDD